LLACALERSDRARLYEIGPAETTGCFAKDLRVLRCATLSHPPAKAGVFLENPRRVGKARATLHAQWHMTSLRSVMSRKP
jgi:hypothetical protein